MVGRGSPPLLRGTLDVMVLQALTHGANHGYGITAWLEQRSGGVVEVDDSAMYQALHRLEERELVQAEWARTETGREARYYTLTAAGRAWLRSQSGDWFRYSAAVTSVLRAPE